MIDDVCRSVRHRRHANKKYMKMRRVCGVNDERTKSAKTDYFKEKEETIHAHNKGVMRKLGNNERQSYITI